LADRGGEHSTVGGEVCCLCRRDGFGLLVFAALKKKTIVKSGRSIGQTVGSWQSTNGEGSDTVTKSTRWCGIVFSEVVGLSEDYTSKRKGQGIIPEVYGPFPL